MDPPVHYQSQLIKDIFQEIINAITEAITIVTPTAILEKSYMVNPPFLTVVARQPHKVGIAV